MKKFYSLLAVAAISMTVSAQQTVFEATFDDITGTGGNDGKWSGQIANNSLSSYETGGSWTLANAYSGNNAVKLGSGSNLGSITTPTIVAEGVATLTFRAGAWDSTNESTTLKISATGATLDQATVTLVKGSFTTYTVNITGANKAVKIKFEGQKASNSRFFIDDIRVTVPTQAVTDTNATKVNLVKNTVVANEIIFGQEAQVSVINMAGQVVKTAEVKDNSRLDVSNLAKGTYIVTATVNGKAVSQKVIKK
ncbi:Por secretion system C-terminal sorting domain-containing protein [Soonwooa buanensis]|uniref:Por secretion system C-terminal sorting domain-containing protein n=1 Tax=Soonwooa buanensis TaxID=619805 RepID=A0A1T5CTU5_9FLAO|nr:T9SS type A sorting domain-containing protein [Soonwooa buanensis]SKB62787.1 Por secretion system C-terminal sorting domain-containing protein [Soonwooa buanensis]